MCYVVAYKARWRQFPFIFIFISFLFYFCSASFYSHRPPSLPSPNSLIFSVRRQSNHNHNSNSNNSYSLPRLIRHSPLLTSLIRPSPLSLTPVPLRQLACIRDFPWSSFIGNQLVPRPASWVCGLVVGTVLVV